MADQLKISFIPHIRQGLSTQLTDPSTLTDAVRQSVKLRFNPTWPIFIKNEVFSNKNWRIQALNGDFISETQL